MSPSNNLKIKIHKKLTGLLTEIFLELSYREYDNIDNIEKNINFKCTVVKIPVHIICKKTIIQAFTSTRFTVVFKNIFNR